MRRARLIAFKSNKDNKDIFWKKNYKIKISYTIK